MPYGSVRDVGVKNTNVSNQFRIVIVAICLGLGDVK